MDLAQSEKRPSCHRKTPIEAALSSRGGDRSLPRLAAKLPQLEGIRVDVVEAGAGQIGDLARSMTMGG